MATPPLYDSKLGIRKRVRWFSVTTTAIAGGIWLGSITTAPVSAVASVLAGVLFTPLLLWTRTWRRPRPELTGRRKVLRSLLGTPLVTLSLVALASYEVWSTAAIRLFSLGNPVRHLFPFLAPPPRQAGFPVAGLEAEVTPTPLFYVNSKNATDPLLLAEDWSLRISGAIRNPLTLTYQQLLDMPRTDLYMTMCCVVSKIARWL